MIARWNRWNGFKVATGRTPKILAAIVLVSGLFLSIAIAKDSAAHNPVVHPTSTKSVESAVEDKYVIHQKPVEETEQPNQLSVGDTLPKISTFDIFGNVFDSEEVQRQGRYLLVGFFTTYCKPCIDEFNDFKRLIAELNGHLEIVLVSVGQDDRNALKQFQGKHKLGEFSIIRDKFGIVQNLFDVESTVPVTILSNEEGVVVHTQYGAFTDGEAYDVLHKLMSYPTDE